MRMTVAGVVSRLGWWLVAFGALVGPLGALPSGLPEVGGDLRAIAREFEDQGYTAQATGLRTEWVGSEVFISSIGFQKDGDIGFRLLVCRGQPVGLGFTGSKTSVILDTDGDGRLDLELTGRLFVPCWVFDRDDPGTGRSALLLEALDSQWAMLASDAGVDAGHSPFLARYHALVARFQREPNLVDRSLAYRVWFYSTTVQEFPQVARDALEGCVARFGGEAATHPMVLQYLSEVALRLDDRGSARRLNRLVRNARPDFVPAQVLEARLLDPPQRQEVLASLKAKYPHHWITKGF